MPNIERLKHLVTILQKVKPKQFDLQSWQCGTTACAVGHACFDPQFRKEGLGFVLGGPKYKEFFSWAAVMAFFGLTIEQAEHLFHSDKYDRGEGTTANVIARIEALIKETQPCA